MSMHGLRATVIRGGIGLAMGFVLIALPGAALAQIVSAGRATLTIDLGQGSGPAGGAAQEVASQQELPHVTKSTLGWRITGGYNFADYWGVETGITRIARISSSAPYLTTDQINAQSELTVFDVNLIGRIPLSSRARIDLMAGPAESSLYSSLSTALGSSLPSGQSNPVHVRRFGYDAGIDAEWMLSEHLSFLVGYHIYPNVGSARVIGSSNGNFSLLAAGIHVEF